MPKFKAQTTLEVTPDQFLSTCSQQEIYDTWLLINSHRYRQTIIQFDEKPNKKVKKSKAKQVKA